MDARAPKVPPYWDTFAPTHYATSKPLKDIRTDLEAGFAHHNIECGKSEETRVGYDCTVEHLGAYLQFTVYVFEREDDHVVEFLHAAGCRLTCSNLLFDLAKTMQVEFPGGGKALPMGPPPLPEELQLVISKEHQTTSMQFVINLISDDCGMVVQGLRCAGSTALNKKSAWLFAPGNLGVQLAFQTAVVFAQSDDLEVRIIAMYAMSHMVHIEGACPSMLSALNAAAMRGVEDANPHVRRLAAACL